MNEQQYCVAVQRIAELMDTPNLTPQEDAELDRLVAQAEEYEKEHYGAAFNK